VIGAACYWKAIGLFPLTEKIYTQDVLVYALKNKNNADALVQVTIDQSDEFWLLAGKHCIRIEGIAVRAR
jgi:hypothetical protein